MTEATQLFENGHNCAQSMLFAYGKQYFKDEASALRLTSAFGAGISYRGEVCGAVSGSLMAIGLHFGHDNPENSQSKEETLEKTKEFLSVFENQHGSINCNQLLKHKINTPEGLEYAREAGLFKKTCPALIRSASQILESIIQKR